MHRIAAIMTGLALAWVYLRCEFKVQENRHRRTSGESSRFYLNSFRGSVFRAGILLPFALLWIVMLFTDPSNPTTGHPDPATQYFIMIIRDCISLSILYYTCRILNNDTASHVEVRTDGLFMRRSGLLPCQATKCIAKWTANISIELVENEGQDFVDRDWFLVVNGEPRLPLAGWVDRNRLVSKVCIAAGIENPLGPSSAPTAPIEPDLVELLSAYAASALLFCGLVIMVYMNLALLLA